MDVSTLGTVLRLTREFREKKDDISKAVEIIRRVVLNKWKRRTFAVWNAVLDESSRFHPTTFKRNTAESF